MIPLRFEYIDALGLKNYVSILHQFKHHYTGETMYRVRLEHSLGGAKETIFSQSDIMKLLDKKENA